MTARHAATDGSFGRSAGGAAARGAGLLAVAVIIGILLLRSGGGDPYSRSVSTGANPCVPWNAGIRTTAELVRTPPTQPQE